MFATRFRASSAPRSPDRESSVKSGSWWSSSIMARGMCQFEVTMISELKLCSMRPAPGLDGVAEGVERGAVEIDAAGEIFGIERRQPRDLAGAGGAVDAGDQQALAALGRQQLDGVGNARGGAGQHHDAVGLAVELHLLGRDVPARTRRSRRSAARRRPCRANMVRKPIQRARPASMLVDGLQRAVDRVARGERGDHRDQHDLRQHRDIAARTRSRSVPNSAAGLLGRRRAGEQPR